MTSEDTKPHNLKALLRQYEERHRGSPGPIPGMPSADAVAGAASPATAASSPSKAQPTSGGGGPSAVRSPLRQVLAAVRRTSLVNQLSGLMFVLVAVTATASLMSGGESNANTALANTALANTALASGSEPGLGEGSPEAPLELASVRPVGGRPPLTSVPADTNPSASPGTTAGDSSQTAPNGTPEIDEAKGTELAGEAPSSGAVAPSGPTLERQAVDAVHAGDRETALRCYGELSRRRPQAAVYREAIRILSSGAPSSRSPATRPTSPPSSTPESVE